MLRNIFQFDIANMTPLKWAAINALLLALLPIKVVIADDYSDGFAAYINGDFVEAQQYWLEGARNGDAKSMFNLGLLNEQSRLTSGDSLKAEEWYRKAADNGYSAANYHLAQRLFERGGSDDQAMALVKSAAEQGYAPAVRYMGGESPYSLAVSASTGVLKKGGGYQVEGWINKQQGKYWTIQLLAFKQESKVQSFINDHGLQEKAAYFVEKKDGVLWYKLIYGSFDSKDKATFARQNLSKTLQEFGPWLRTIASVQAITKP